MPASLEGRLEGAFETPGPHPRWFELEVPGYLPSWVVLPRGPTSSSRLPFVFAVHGAGDNAYYQCLTWQRVFEESAVLVCPAGTPMTTDKDGPYFFRDHHALENEVLAVFGALRRALGEALKSDGGLYVAYSQGATMGALMLVRHGGLFPRLLLAEGGTGQWNVAQALKFKRSGGVRVLFACGTRTCARKAQRDVAWLRQAGLGSQVVTAEGAGHTYGGAVQRAALSQLEWLQGGGQRR